MFRIRKDGRFVDQYSYNTFEAACWAWFHAPDSEVVEVDTADKDVMIRRCTAQECREQLSQSPAPGQSVED